MSLSLSAIARVTGVDVAYRNFNRGRARFLPQRLAVIAQGRDSSTYSLDKFTALSAGQVGERMGYGSPAHLIARQLFPESGDGIGGIPVTIYPLEADSSAVAAAGAITASGTEGDEAIAGTVTIGGVESDPFVIPASSSADAALELIKTAINSVLHMPVVAGTVNSGSLPLAAKWSGLSGNDITINVDQITDDSTIVYGSTAFSGGLVNPDVDDALANIGEVWETFILNAMNYDDTTTLGKFRTWGEGRWTALNKKPALVAVGCVDDFDTRTAITDAAAQQSDRINFLIQSTGSQELPFVIAARGLAKDIIPTANDNPAQGYKGRLTGLQTGADSVQENYTTRNNAIKLGASTNIKVGSVAELSDIVTMYHPASDPDASFRYVVNIVKLQNIVYNVRLIFEADDWKGAPLLPDSAVTTNPTAKQPKNAAAALATLADNLELAAIIADAKFTKQNLSASISSQNPNRLDTTFPVKLSGNTEVKNNDIYFGFYLGAA
jgi:phage tail sheath gpL-like